MRKGDESQCLRNFLKILKTIIEILQHRIEYAREDSDWNVVNVYFVAADQRRQSRKMEKIVLLKMIFKQTTFVTKSQYFFEHATYCCAFPYRLWFKLFTWDRKFTRNAKDVRKLEFCNGQSLVFVE